MLRLAGLVLLINISAVLLAQNPFGLSENDETELPCRWPCTP